MKINEIVRATVEKYKMIARGDNVTVCVSGGADSMALLTVLSEEKDVLGINELTACHFNHALRGEESDRDENAVRDYCALLSVKLFVDNGRMNEIALPKGESVESYARALRYNFFDEVSAANGSLIATAHNKNDVAETVIFNLTRGTGIRGARGVPPVRDNIIRPLIDVSRNEIEAYCTQKDIPYVNDSSNYTDDYSRNKIRHNVIPALLTINENAINNIARFSKQAEEAARIFEINNNRLLSRAETEGGFDILVLRQYEPAEIKYFLKGLIEKHRQVSEETVELATRLVLGDLNELQLAKGVYLSRKGTLLYVRFDDAAEKSENFSQKLKVGKNDFLDDISVWVVEENTKNEQLENFSDYILNNSIDCDKISGSIILRNRLDGDEFTSNRRKNTKKIKKLFNERAIPTEYRDSVPIISDDEGIIWIAGEGVCKRAAVNEATNKIHIITVK